MPRVTDRQLLEAERDKLIAANDAAPGWGAGVVGARRERIKEINVLLAGDNAARKKLIGEINDD